MISRGVTPELFVDDASGQECREVFSWASEYARRYGSCPSSSYVQHHFRDWKGEFSTEPIEALLDEFLAEVRRRYFEAKVLELSRLPNEPDYWTRRESLDEVLYEAAREVSAIIPAGTVARFSDEFELQIERYEDEKGRHRPGIPLGIPVIDQLTGGIKSGWLTTIAGFSGIGKSLAATRSILSAFEDDKVALMLSLEMTAQEVLDRLHTMVMNWKHRDLVNRSLSDTQMRQWRDVARVYSRAKGEIIVLDKLGGCSLDRVHAEIERYKPDVVALDYVQRMRASYASRRPKWEQLEEITNELKTIAMDTDSSIIMVSQDGRESAEQGSTKTNMGGSISVYQAADAYLGMYSDEGMRAQGRMRFRLLKFRHGSQGAEVDVVWQPEVGRFFEVWTDANQFVRAPV